MKDKDREEHPSRKQKLHVYQNTSSDSRAPPQVSERVSCDKNNVMMTTNNTDIDIDVYDQLLDNIFPDEDVNYYEYEYPPGYKFKPHDYELVAFYLRRKLQGKSLPRNVVHDVDLYLFNPENLTASYPTDDDEKKEWYFFTPRKRKYPNGRRPDRAAGNGYWKASGADQTVTCTVEEKEIIVGFRKTLVFYEGKAPKGDKTDWIMHEFTVRNPPKRTRENTDMRLDDWVLCRIHKKEDKKDTEQHDDAPQEEAHIPSVPEIYSRRSPLGFFAIPAGTYACYQNSGITSAQQNASIATPQNPNHQSRFGYNDIPTSTSACYHNSGISTQQNVAARATATPATIENHNHRSDHMGYRGSFASSSACYQNFGIPVQRNAFTKGPARPIMIENHDHRSQFGYNDRPTSTSAYYHNSGISTQQNVAARATATPATVENHNHRSDQMGHRGSFDSSSACYQNFGIPVQRNAFTKGPASPIMIENHHHRRQFGYLDEPGTSVSYQNSQNVLSTVPDRVAVPSIALKQSPIHVPDHTSYDDFTIDSDELFLNSDCVDEWLNFESDDVSSKSPDVSSKFPEDGAK